MAEFRPVLLTLPSLTPSLALEILPHGLTLHRIIVQADGRTHDIVIGPELPEDHVTQKYTNSIVGRYSNRVPVGTHILERNGIKSEFTAVANENPRVSLHGGPIGFDAVPWTLLTSANPATLFSEAELKHLSSPNVAFAIFRLISADGDQGYPGKLVIEALVALVGPGEQERKYRTPADVPQAIAPEYDLGSIVLTYRAKLDEVGKKTVTPLNLTQHWGFNLEASLRERPLATVNGHTLTIKSDRVAELGPDSLFTGTYLLAEDRSPHAHTAKKIGDLFPAKSYDDYYLLQNPGATDIPTRIPLSSFNPELDLIKDVLQPSNDDQGNPTRGNRPAPVVELTSDKSGIKLVFDTNQRGVMFYANGLANQGSGARKKIHGGSGIRGNGGSYGPGTAAFLEFHEPLAAFLDPKNKDGDDTLLTTDELYHNYVRCDVKFKEVAE
ncbi:galactose mutarotase-like domain-containing protein [Lyophyllum atratum]|nr:galactose mutarotase-like domain-containing protein [Lyophyllum atratum]